MIPTITKGTIKMRKILFRGKCLTSKQWNYGCYVDVPGYKPHIIKSSGNSHNVDPETVGQYTGIKDKNGVKIFEGDIVQNHGEHWKRVVYFDIGKLQFRIKENTDSVWEKNDSCFGYGAKDIEKFEYEITGNIHKGD